MSDSKRSRVKPSPITLQAKPPTKRQAKRSVFASNPDRDAVDLWSRPGFLVRRLHQISVAIFHDEMDLDLTPVQFGALAILESSPGIEQSALGEDLGIDRVNTGDVISRLEKNDLVRREISQIDRRYRNIFLTKSGEKILQKCKKRMQKVQDRFMAPLTPEEQQIFMRLVIQLIEGNNDQGRAVLRLPEHGRSNPLDEPPVSDGEST